MNYFAKHDNNNNKKKGLKKMNIEKPELTLKKLTLIAWARILLVEGKISLAKCNKMIVKFEKLTS